MAVIKISNGKKLCWYPGEILPEREEIDPRLLLSELTDEMFPWTIEKSAEQQDCIITHKFEIRITKKGGLAMHHMGMNVKRKTPSPAEPVLPLKTGGEL